MGPPGTGKTTYLMREIKGLVDAGYSLNDITFVSHTTAAANEVLTRLNLPRSDKVCTIHALCFRLLKLSSQSVIGGRHLKEFEQVVNVPISGRKSEDDGQEVGDMYLDVISYARNKMITYEEAYYLSERPGTHLQFMYFVEAYEAWKKSGYLIDYTDMLDRYYNHGNPPSDGSRVLIIDEAQDLSNMQWAVIDTLISVGDHEQVIIAGDDDQCQPPNTKILTPSGEVNIQDINNNDKVISYSSTKGYFSQRSVKITSRHYDGPLISILAGGKTSSYTPSHRCMVTYENDDNLRAVYIMRRGNDFRVGQTKAFKRNSNGRKSLYPVVRARQEGADALWIISVHSNIRDAYLEEQRVSVEYGIPQTVFNYKGMGLCGLYTDGVWAALSGIDLASRAARALTEFGMDINYPHISHSGGTKHFQCYAGNLIPGLHKVAISDGKLMEWVPITKCISNYSGLVYSMEVDKTSTYIADGIYTHNCIYKWGGADTDGIPKFCDKYSADVTVLDQSYRIPWVVHRLSQRLIGQVSNRMDKSYKPRDDGGTLVRYGEFQNLLDSNGLPLMDTLVLGRTHSIVHEMERELIADLIPYVKEGGRPGMFENRYANALRAFNKMKKDIEPRKSERDAYDRVCYDSFRDGLGLKHKSFEQVLDIPFSFVPYYNSVNIDSQPHVRLSTIHSSKGKEADRVVLSTELTPRIAEHMAKSLDDEIRVFYVGMTRAKHSLDVVGDGFSLIGDIING